MNSKSRYGEKYIRVAIASTLLMLVNTIDAWNPDNQYAPTHIDCPQDASFVRRAEGLSPEELAWVDARHKVTDPLLIDFLGRMYMEDFEAGSYLRDTSLKIGLAFSGGGYRAMLNGAGQISALDSRTVNSTKEGHLGGLLQAATYITGLSGGNWLVNSMVLNNFSSIQDLQNSQVTWDLTVPIFSVSAKGPAPLISAGVYYDNLKEDLKGKEVAGFRTSITDLWGRVLSYQFIGLNRGGPALQYSDIQNYDAFKSHVMPYPLVVSLGRAPGTRITTVNSTVFETSPFHLGSWDPSLYAFTNTRYLGSNVSNGVPLNDQSCVTGFDNAGFVLGTSSSLFNQFLLQLNSSGLSGGYLQLMNSILVSMDKGSKDIAVYSPNPFLNLDGDTAISKSDTLSLVDGGEDNQNVPFYPLQQSVRELDVIFAFDNSADTRHHWPNGASLGATYDRQFGPQGNTTMFPYVPDNNTFINLGLGTKPTFFGCYASNFTSLRHETGASSDYSPPLIVFTSNHPYSYASNTSTFKMVYTTNEVSSMIRNGYNVMTRGNSTDDPEWGACVGCAIIQREVERRNDTQTEQCKRCFERYCWDGTLNTTLPHEYEPPMSGNLNSQIKV